ncbi:MAG: ACP S-malonyltransferase [Candidatus Krumholzibacteriota bacterium]|nr:ACP S-malonyltransferase [Candidatus Krumholzibacteriota bacterium]
MKAAMLFPGQGSQFVGMGKDLAENFSIAAELYEEADEALGFSISRLCFEGDAAELTETRNAQPAILLHSIIAARILLEEAGIEPAIAAGHSLGEYSALVASNVLDGIDALKIVRRRGELMFDAGLSQPGTMAAIIGMADEDVARACEEASSGDQIVVVANINSPGQIVISGNIGAVEKAMEIADSNGAKKVVKLNVSGAFHSPLVASAEKELVSYIGSFSLSDASTGVICNADAKMITSRSDIIDALSRQLTNPVLWSDSMRLLAARWDGPIIEAGPGRVLAGLMKRIDRSRTVESAGTVEDIQKLLERKI